jgi:hypothetical protein
VDWSRSPLIECFERGEVEADVRMAAASGALALPVPEQLTLLMLLSSDADPAIAARAARTIGRLPSAALAEALTSPEVPERVRAFFAARPQGGSEESSEAGVEDESAPDESDAPEDEQADAGDAEAGASDAGAMGAAAGVAPAERRDAVRRLASMTVAGRIKAAMQGTREERAILVRDPNRIVAVAVLSSPKLTEGDVEAIARMTNVSDDVLRIIGSSRTWTKNYSVVSALARNAKTPIGVSLTLLPRLTERDIKLLATDRNIPEPVRLSARKLYSQKASRRQ